jgi:transposase
MSAYSEDLRRKVLEAVRRGMGKSEAARTFGVSLSSVKRYVSKALEGASLLPREHRGLQLKIDEHARRLLEADPGELGGQALCVLDEMSTNTSLCALYGWSRIGEGAL